ncbi:MAG: aldehyde ferredoxin oxidoreductase C-terminal domain-containing protein, partial [Dehalococcoidia bacterium]|nr:aldehyde ferredoxin oxidoreductase C-terminal domain-containing protein [Dehalococcoidia bacterium]
SEGRFAMEGPGPEYETLAMFGTICMNDDLESLCAANDLCNRYGLDTISAGATVAFAMEAYERGILTRADTGGVDLSWGNVDGILEITKQMGEARGIGKLLGKGVKRASEELGQGSEAFAVHVKGMEVPAHDPRAYFSMAINYATGPRGACHLHGMPMLYEQGVIFPEAGIFQRQGRFDRKGKGLAAKVAQDLATLLNSLVICTFAGTTRQPGQMAASLELATGIPYTGAEVFQAGERIVNLQRMFSLRCGLDPAEDKLPPRLMEPTDEGGHAGKVPYLADGIREYYQVRGWTEDGRPSPEKLHELGLDFALNI